MRWIGTRDGELLERNRRRKAGRYLPASPLTNLGKLQFPFSRSPGSPVFTIGYPMPNPMRGGYGSVRRGRGAGGEGGRL